MNDYNEDEMFDESNVLISHITVTNAIVKLKKD